jgi:hypothetical protein
VGGLDRAADDSEQVGAHRVEVNCVAQPGGECRDGQLRVVTAFHKVTAEFSLFTKTTRRQILVGGSG